ncbi:MAG: (2Fe-2S)-binding protein [Alphaproteobacteria bacterium]|nr:(2Fe-2S)-binding protein [Alphaproteobacteria bacterium]
MAKVTFIAFDGSECTIDIAAGLSLMEGAVANRVPGIVAECGGAMACGTCHVYVDPAWAGRIGDKSELEDGMLQTVLYGGPQSRLSCQIRINDALDGLIVRTPQSQF